MRKIRMFAEFAMPLGVPILALGVAMQTKADLGLSMVVSPAYVLSLRFPALSFGAMDYVVQFSLLVLLLAITRKFTMKFLLAFVTSAYYGAMLDLCLRLLAGLNPQNLAVRVVLLALGQCCSALAVALFFRANLPLMAYDMFIKELALFQGWNLDKSKFLYDLTLLGLTVALALVFFGQLKGVGVGTLAIALANGPMIAGIGKILDKGIDFSPKFEIHW